MTRNTHFINGEWINGLSTDSQIHSLNPATGEVIWNGSAGSAEVVDSAFAAARQAFRSWASLGVEARLTILRRYQEILKQRKSELAQIISAETGKQLWEATTEAATMIGKIDLSISSFDQRTGSTSKDLAGIQAKLTHRPHGVMLVLGPYNFPGHLPNGHIVPALIAGNTVVFKPSELTPLVGQTMIEAMQEAGIPAGVVNLVQGDGKTGMLLSNHPEVDGLLFTGSSKTGTALHAQFGGQPGKMLALEMGGNNPLIVAEVQDIAAAVYNTIQSAFITSGQRCTCARRLIVVRDERSETFVDALLEATKSIKVAMPQDDPEAFFGPVISNQVADMLMSAQQEMIANGAKPLIPMERPDKDMPLIRPGILDVTEMAKREDEELFGPLLQIIWVDDLEQAIVEANNTKYGLAAGMLTDNDDFWEQFYLSAKAGIVNRNRPTTGASGGAPFGGIGASGNHRPSAFYAADYCAYPMASMIDDRLEVPQSLTPGIKLK